MMKRALINTLCVLLLATSLAAGAGIQPARAQAGAHTPTPTALTEIPTGFRLVDAALGVQLYRKDYANGNPDFVQVIDLGLGARIALLHGEITERRPEKGSFGGPDPRMTSLALQTYWQQARSQDNHAFCVTNGGFFYMPEYPTRLAFPLKVDGEIISEGWGIETYVRQQLMLELWPEQAQIQPLSQEALYASQAPDILGGLSEQANKRLKYAVGRTFVGVDDRDGDGQHETVLILNTKTATQSAAAGVLRDFGADQVMMLDGGGSTQLLCRSGYHINSERPIPQALTVIAARPPPVSMQVLRRPEWPVLVQGETFPFEMEILNTGVVTWSAQTTRLELDPGRLGKPRWLEIESPIRPGERRVFSDTLRALHQPGLYPLRMDWQIIHEEKSYPGSPLEIQAIVLPQALREQRPELEQALKGWQGNPQEQIRARVEAWVEERSGEALLQAATATAASPAASAGSIRPLDAMLVPLLMLPIVILMGFLIGRKNTPR